jgi:hypothetical protein
MGRGVWQNSSLSSTAIEPHQSVRNAKLIISPEDAFQVGEEPEKDSDRAGAEDDDGEPGC